MVKLESFIHTLKKSDSIPSKTPGVYCIVCLKNNKIYIGSSIDLAVRISTHKSALRYGKHTVESLQYDFDKYGEDNFKFGVLETYEPVSPVIVRIKEQEYVDEIKPNFLYNQTKTIFAETSIMGFSNEDLVSIISFNDESIRIKELQDIARPILLSRFRKNPEDALDFILKTMKKNFIKNEIKSLNEYSISELMRELADKVHKTELEYSILKSEQRNNERNHKPNEFMQFVSNA